MGILTNRQFDQLTNQPCLDYILSYHYPCLAKLAKRVSCMALRSFGGSSNSDLPTILIASSEHPVAQTAQPKHVSRSTLGTSSSPMVRALAGQRSMQVSQATQRSGSHRGSKPEEFSTFKPLKFARIDPQCQRSQLHM